jgi:hypothetical protein
MTSHAVESPEPPPMGASHREWRLNTRLALALGIMGVACILAAVIGLLGGPVTVGEETEVQELGGGTGWVALGIMVGVVFQGWARTGSWLMQRTGPLRRHRIEIHNWISIGALGLALFHGIELMALGDFRGWLSGSVATILMIALFVHGWWRQQWIQAFGRRPWRIVHWELAVGAIAFSLLHWLLIEVSRPAVV